MKIDSILNASFEMNCTGIELRAGKPPIAYVNSVKILIPGYESALTIVEISEIISELIDYKNLTLGSTGLVFPYTDLEHSDYKVTILTPRSVHFERVSKSV
jgi:hypothetical protein